MSSLPVVQDALFGPEYDKRYAQLGEGENGNCAVCGRRIRSATPAMVRTAYGADVVDPDAEIDDAADSGWFPVGPECAKKAKLRPYTRSDQ